MRIAIHDGQTIINVIEADSLTTAQALTGLQAFNAETGPQVSPGDIKTSGGWSAPALSSSPTAVDPLTDAINRVAILEGAIVKAGLALPGDVGKGKKPKGGA